MKDPSYDNNDDDKTCFKNEESRTKTKQMQSKNQLKSENQIKTEQNNVNCLFEKK